MIKDNSMIEDTINNNNLNNFLNINMNINDQSRNNISLNKSRLLSKDLKKYHFSIDAFNDKIMMEKSSINQSPSMSRIEMSKLSLHPRELRGRISNMANTSRL